MAPKIVILRWYTGGWTIGSTFGYPPQDSVTGHRHDEEMITLFVRRPLRYLAPLLVAAVVGLLATPAFADAETPTVTTEIHLMGVHSPVSAVDLASQIHDQATVETSTNDIPSGSYFTFDFYSGTGCVGTPGTEDSNTFGGTGVMSHSEESADTDPLHAGDYSYKVYFTSGDSESVADGEAECENVTVSKADLASFTTDIHNTADDSVVTGGSVDLGSQLYDEASAVGNGVTGFDPAGTVDFDFFSNGDCTPTYDGTENIALASGVADSSDSANLHAGDYSYLAHYNDTSGDYNDTDATCEAVTVNKADTTTTTQTLNHDGDPISFIGPQLVHDSATVDTSGYAGFDLAPSTGVTFKLYHNGTCSPDGETSEVVSISGSPPQTVYSSETALTPGLWSYQADYSGNDDYNGSTSVCEPVTVLPTITRGSCSFDLYPDVAGRQLRLIYTPDPASLTNYRLSATNPGEFYYNAVLTGDPDDPFSVDITLPYPWVTKGSVPTHVFDAVDLHQAGSDWCAAPSGTQLGQDTDQVLLGGYDSGLGDTQTLNVTGTFDSTGLAFIRVHMDYGLKATLPWVKGTSNDGTNNTLTPAVHLINNQEYDFSDTTGSSSSIYSQNVFKRDPGIAGLVLKSDTGDPVVGTAVQIWDAKSGKRLATVYTDADGWYMWTFKYSGKTVTFNIKLPAYGLTQTVTLKAKTFLSVSFAVT